MKATIICFEHFVKITCLNVVDNADTMSDYRQCGYGTSIGFDFAVGWSDFLKLKWREIYFSFDQDKNRFAYFAKNCNPQNDSPYCTIGYTRVEWYWEKKMLQQAQHSMLRQIVVGPQFQHVMP